MYCLLQTVLKYKFVQPWFHK
ncbi:hypothetical protein FWK35_00010416 [Aphis craccivora]|uniref:Uncharacterized protein n=1 Tax=Aphis craccivora TaxID=307492 RepID=A0A6G0ZNN3_APHCR|nr:hypothetical protein FWK35_00010416 [Aphis craccivora]